jgi:hypothetical protein
MSDLLRISLVSGYRAGLKAILPRLSETDLAGFDALLARDAVVADDGSPHPDLVAWVRCVLRAGGGAACPVAGAPVPKTGPAGAEVVA